VFDVAYYGNNRGLDAWMGFDGFATLGDAWPDLGKAEEEAEALELADIDGAILGKARAELEQAHGRARDTSRSAPAWHLHLGSVAPTSWHTSNTRIERTLPGRPKAASAMPAAEFSAAGNALGWTMRSGATALGRSKSDMQRWYAGVRGIPAAIAERVRELLDAAGIAHAETSSRPALVLDNHCPVIDGGEARPVALERSARAPARAPAAKRAPGPVNAALRATARARAERPPDVPP
jgi:hypothetical protein